MLISNSSPSYMYKLFHYSPLKIILKVIPTENSLPFSFSGFSKGKGLLGTNCANLQTVTLQKPQGKEALSGATRCLFFPTFRSSKGQDEICSPMYGKLTKITMLSAKGGASCPPSLGSVPNGGPTGRAPWQGPERQRSASPPAETA